MARPRRRIVKDDAQAPAAEEEKSLYRQLQSLARKHLKLRSAGLKMLNDSDRLLLDMIRLLDGRTGPAITVNKRRYRLVDHFKGQLVVYRAARVPRYSLKEE